MIQDEFCIVLIDGQLKHRSVQVLRNEDRLGWTADLLRIKYEFRVDIKGSSAAHANKMSKF